ncbi:Alpha-glucosidase 2 [Purpureocillium lavendulum]|uniref:Alpha-glucosidase 2 n=1 Tax=Purpureocillium lavendulum TaxID=1247861 RepID=A0AB34FN83_9HYPO|nr:Alpha-glucosidase 2 [Purpureocillium lavendulum]
MTKGIFRIFNPAAPKEDPVDKRRDQLRRAQKSYRDRRSWYTRCLEKDLQQTRAREAKLLQECEHLRVAVSNAMSVLDELGVELPSEPKLANTTQSPPAHGSSDDSPRSPEWLPIPLMTGFHSKTEASPPFGVGRYPASTLSSTPLKSPAPMADQRRTMEEPDDVAVEKWPTLQNLSQTSILSDDRVCMGDLDVVTLGMEFVLKIEEPCLGHIHGNLAKPDEPNGHALTTSAQLLASSHGPTYTPGATLLPPLPYHDAPVALLERLLSLAPDLSTYGEVTPIQAWNRIRYRPDFQGLDVHLVHTLADKLKEAAKCHGDNGSEPVLSLTTKLRLADTAAERYSLLPNDKDFTFSFNESKALFANRQSFPALVGTGGSMAIADFPPCSIGFLHLHPRAAELFTVVSGRVVTEMVPEAGVVDSSGKQRVIRTDLGPREMTFFPMGSFHTQVNPECEPAMAVASFPSEDSGASAVVGQTFALSNDIIESAFGQSIKGEDIDRIRKALPQSMVTRVEECLTKCGIQKRAIAI